MSDNAIPYKIRTEFTVERMLLMWALMNPDAPMVVREPEDYIDHCVGVVSKSNLSESPNS